MAEVIPSPPPAIYVTEVFGTPIAFDLGEVGVIEAGKQTKAKQDAQPDPKPWKTFVHMKSGACLVIAESETQEASREAFARIADQWKSVRDWRA